jgi:cytochrome d ubiquinol oxidase subunit II
MDLTHPELQFLMFTTFVILVTGYAILDGFDLGVGILHLCSTKDEERRLMLNSIGPVWDGNEVWLVTAGGALFAGFPQIYATLCTAFYVPLMGLLMGIIFRAVAIEFRSKQPMAWWRWTWDVLFSLASFLIAFSLGVVMGTLIHGLPLDSAGEFVGTWRDLVHPYALLVGLLTVFLFTMHGAIYIVMKTEGELHERMRRWILPAIIGCVLVYGITTMATLIFEPRMIAVMRTRPILFGVAVLNVLVLANIPREITRGNDGRAFICSCLNIVLLMVLFGIGTYPQVVHAINDPENLSMTIFNSSSSPKTLSILLLVTLLGVPLVLTYTISIYWIFRGKVRLDPTSY